MTVPKPSLTVQELLAKGAAGGLDEGGMIALARHWRTLFALGTPDANDTAVGQLAQLAGRSLDRLHPPGTFACRKGCSHCCFFHVGLPFLAALRSAGRFGHAYELNGILSRLLADPGLEARWYGGEDVFADLADGMVEALGPAAGLVEALAWHAGRP